jgi:uroporphyrinogen decarboxylase
MEAPSTMTSRERVLAALTFQRPDRLPISDSLWDGLQAEWVQEGMPAGVSPADHFGWDIESLFIDASARFDMVLKSRQDGYLTYEDRAGYTVKKLDGKSGTLQFLDYKTKTRTDWEMVTKPRMILDDPSGSARIDSASYFCHFDAYPRWEEAKRRFDAIYARGRFVQFAAYGPWEATWRHHAMAELLIDVFDDPDWCADMFATYTDLLIQVLRRGIDHGMKPDGIFLVEDMGFKTSLLISPDTWDQLLRPCYARLNEFLRRHGIHFLMHTDGCVWELLPRLIAVGVEALNPFECGAGMDIAELRQRHPRQLTCFGNLSAANLLGNRIDLDQELLRKIPFATNGGFIMHSDHSIPFGVHYEQYRWACQRAQEIFAEGAESVSS